MNSQPQSDFIPVDELKSQVSLEQVLEGEAGMKQCLGYLSQLIAVRVGWNQKMFEGRYLGKEAEHLDQGSLIEIEGYARKGKKD